MRRGGGDNGEGVEGFSFVMDQDKAAARIAGTFIVPLGFLPGAQFGIVGFVGIGDRGLADSRGVGRNGVDRSGN